MVDAIIAIRELPVVAVDAIDDLTVEQKNHWKEKIRQASTQQAIRFYNGIMQTGQHRYAEILDAVGALPIKELAQVASTLVSLSSFQQRMSFELETVGGPTDVAVISKGDGFIWVDRKHYFKRELNSHFFENYFRTVKNQEEKHEGIQDDNDTHSGSENDG